MVPPLIVTTVAAGAQSDAFVGFSCLIEKEVKPPVINSG